MYRRSSPFNFFKYKKPTQTKELPLSLYNSSSHFITYKHLLQFHSLTASAKKWLSLAVSLNQTILFFNATNSKLQLQTMVTETRLVNHHIHAHEMLISSTNSFYFIFVYMIIKIFIVDAMIDDVYVWLCFCHQFCVMASSSDVERTIIRKEKDEWKINFSSEKPPTPLLDTVNYPVHMKNLSTQVRTVN